MKYWTTRLSSLSVSSLSCSSSVRSNSRRLDPYLGLERSSVVIIAENRAFAGRSTRRSLIGKLAAPYVEVEATRRQKAGPTTNGVETNGLESPGQALIPEGN